MIFRPERHSEKCHCLIADRLGEGPVQFKHCVSSNLVKSVEAGATSASGSRSESDVKPRTSINTTDTTAGSTRGGPNSYHMAHRLGFFREGRIPTMRNGIENTP